MTSAHVETDDELLLRMQSGDEEAFLALYRRRQAGLFRFALHMSGSLPVAEDVTQEVFLALLREDCGFDPERGTLSVDKAKSLISYNPQFPLEKGFAEYLGWYKEFTSHIGMADFD